jgi:hypothetical protein
MDTWFSRDLPVLVALADHFDDPQAQDLLDDGVAELVGRDLDDVHRALRNLAEADYIRGVMVSQAAHPVRISGVTEAGRRAAGQWPALADSLAAGLIAELDRLAEATADPDERGRLRRAADAFRSLSRDVLVGVVSSAIVKAAGPAIGD